MFADQHSTHASARKRTQAHAHTRSCLRVRVCVCICSFVRARVCYLEKIKMCAYIFIFACGYLKEIEMCLLVSPCASAYLQLCVLIWTKKFIHLLSKMFD